MSKDYCKVDVELHLGIDGMSPTLRDNLSGPELQKAFETLDILRILMVNMLSEESK